jgi:hypothetical protein
VGACQLPNDHDRFPFRRTNARVRELSQSRQKGKYSTNIFTSFIKVGWPTPQDLVSKPWLVGNVEVNKKIFEESAREVAMVAFVEFHIILFFSDNF